MSAVGKWVVIELAGLEGFGTPMAGTHLTLEIAEDGSVAGFGGCNRFFGHLGEDGAVGPVGRTMMACAPEVMAQEDAYLGLLERGRSLSTAEGSLEVGDGEQVLLRFASIDGEIVGVTWRLTGIHNGKGGFASVLRDVVVTLQFDDGKLSGNSGCNRYSAAYTVTSDRLAIGEPAGTRMMCPAPVMEQEALFLRWLPEVGSYRLSIGRSGRTLDLEGQEGMRLLQFVEEE